MIHTILARPSPRVKRTSRRDYISFSAIRAYQSCPLRYAFRNVMGLPDEAVSAAIVLGSGVHRAIEHHLRELLAGNPAPGGSAMLAEFSKEWQERNLDQVRFGKDEDLESMGRRRSGPWPPFSKAKWRGRAARSWLSRRNCAAPSSQGARTCWGALT